MVVVSGHVFDRCTNVLNDSHFPLRHPFLFLNGNFCLSIIGLRCHLEDACNSSPCFGSASCDTSPINGSAICTCQKGWRGDNCSEDINECVESGFEMLFKMSYFDSLCLN